MKYGKACIYVGVGMKMDVPGETNTRIYTSLDEKVGLLIERMSECVRLTQEYMKDRTAEEKARDMWSVGKMLRVFPPCIQALRDNEDQLKTAMLTLIPLRSARATLLREACGEICDFYQNNHNHTRDISPHVRNEMLNLIRFKQNLYPEEWQFGGFTSLDLKQGPLIKWLRQDTQEVVVVSEFAWKTECVVCFVKERDVVVYPCSHFCLCRDCKRSVFTCPMCRSPIREDMAIGDVRRKNRTFIQSTHMSRLLEELQALGSGEN